MNRTTALACTAVFAASMMLAGCSTERGASGPGGGGTDTLTITASGASSTFTRNWNGFSPAARKAPGDHLIYEPLVMVDKTDNKKAKGWLAESFEWRKNGHQLVFHLRDDVTWSDGEPFDAEDVVYTLQAAENGDGLNINPIGYESVRAPDEHTVVVNYDHPAFRQIGDYSGRKIYPEHLWSGKDTSSWTNPDPVGTGPGKLVSFSPQQVRLEISDDYWGGRSKGVKYVNIKPFVNPETAKAMLLKGELDWSTINWQDAKQEFIAKDPENHHYWVYDNGGDEGLDFNTAKKPLDNVHVRRALQAAIDAEKLLSLARTGQRIANPTGYSNTVYTDVIAEEFRGKRVRADPELARSELDKSGYQVRDGHLVKDGKRFPLTLRVVKEYTNWAAWGQGLAEQWRQRLDLKVRVLEMPESQIWDPIREGDFDMALDWHAGGNNPWSAYNSVLNSEYTAPIGEKATSNYVRWNDERTDELLASWAATEDKEKQLEIAAELQRIVVDQVPFAPLFSGSYFVVANSTNWEGWPDPKNADYVPSSTEGPDTIRTVLNLTPAE